MVEKTQSEAQGRGQLDLDEMALAIARRMSPDAVGQMIYAWSDGTITDEPGANDASRTMIVALRANEETHSLQQIRSILEENLSSATVEKPDNLGFKPESGRDPDARDRWVPASPGDQEMQSAPPLKPGQMGTARRETDWPADAGPGREPGAAED